MLVGAVETKVRPAVIIASDSYLRERPDVLVGVLTTKIPLRPKSTGAVYEPACEKRLLSDTGLA
jgi:mRNA-degrading endonuclease toxin of MazEF toxin-antitoxin module